jgi:cytochrome c peroxidase
MLSRAVVRVQIKAPAAGEFELAAVDDPYGHASAAGLSLFRRPLPTTNLRFLSGVSWDGRKTFDGQTIEFGLLDQANGATVGHGQAPQPLTAEERKAIVDFETSIYTAQLWDDEVGWLTADGAAGGAAALSRLPFSIGNNEPVTQPAFDLFTSWQTSRHQARAKVRRGEALFNTRAFPVRNVRGLNDELGQPEVQATCATCHSSPNVGGHAVMRMFDLGISSARRRAPEQPLYTLRHRETGEEIQTTDPGRALISGRWRDVNRFKVPLLRSLAPRPPYFHDGSAPTLRDVVDFYDRRFQMELTEQEKEDLTAFLRVL